MYSAIVNQWLDVSNRATASMLRLNQIALQAIGRTAQQQIDVVGDCMELTIRQMKLVVEAKNRTQILAEEGTLAGEIGNRFVTHTKDFVQIAEETQKAFSGFLEEYKKEPAPESKLKAKMPKAA